MSATAEGLTCWKCGGSLETVLVPFAREIECPACRADLHVCRMCRYFAPGVRRGCHEPVAEEVTDKARRNFCGYFEPVAGLGGAAGEEGAAAKSELDSLFGLGGDGNAGSPSSEDEARKRLEALFGLDKN